jgi:hypothetical protein
MTSGPSGADDRLAISRRKLLRYGGVLGASGLVSSTTGEPRLSRAAAGERAALPLSTFTATISRREDQLSLTLECVNLKLLKVGQAGHGPINSARMVRVVDNDPNTFLIVHFGPQHLAEHAYFETNPDDKEPGSDETLQLTTPTAATVASGSRLAFQVPPSITFIPYDLTNLLAWHRFGLSVVPHALRTVVDKQGPVAPTSTQTWIEVPRRVVLSPHEAAGWAHAVHLTDTTNGGRTELWHTRLGLRTPTGVDEQNTSQRTVRAVWTPGFVKTSPPNDAPDPLPLGRNSLTPRDRYEVVRLSSDYSITEHTQPYLPRPLDVDRLMLSSLGAWLQANGAWPAPVTPADLANAPTKSLTTESWLHRAAMGRDHYVRVVNVGFCLPTGHPAALIRITERKFQNVENVAANDPRKGKPAAFLRHRMFLVPRGGWRDFGAGVAFLPHQGREMPFKKVRITTRVTPNLVPADNPNPVPGTKVPRNPNLDPMLPATACYGLDAFWPMVPLAGGGVGYFPFNLEAEDAEGRMCQLSMPLIFVSAGISNSLTDMEKVVAYYDTKAPAARRAADLNGQQVALARFTGGARGEAAYPTSAITFGAALPNPPGAQLDPRTAPRFFPRMAKAEVRLVAVERVRGGPLATPTHAVTLHPAWLDNTANAAKLFAKLVSPMALTFGKADATGGVITPHMVITGLSALTGPIGGNVDNPLAPAKFMPADFFKGAAPEILGGISLLDVLAPEADFDTGAKAPRLVSTEIPGGIESSLVWKPTLRPSSVFEPHSLDGMTITARTVVRHNGIPPSTEISGEIRNFDLIAVGSAHLATISFRSLRFVSKDGRKPDVDADIIGVTFHGILAFVNALQKFLRSIGAGDDSPALLAAPAGSTTASEQAPPAKGGYVEVTPAGIKIGQTVSVPSVPAGVFLLENISLSSELNIPFDGQPARIRFAFAERERQFHLTVSMFGGGGFCAVSFGLDNFELFEAALEFGAKLSLDIGVASGSVSVMAGIYLALGGSTGELTGYLRINGELDILELISMNIEFYLGFTYDFDKDEVWGEASVTVEIEVLIFSGSVTLGPIRKRFGGGGSAPSVDARGSRTAVAAANGSPSFKDLVSDQDWQNQDTGYCALFAAAAF